MGAGSPAGGVGRAGSQAGMGLPGNGDHQGGVWSPGWKENPCASTSSRLQAQLSLCHERSIVLFIFLALQWPWAMLGLSHCSLRGFPGKMGGTTSTGLKPGIT